MDVGKRTVYQPKRRQSDTLQRLRDLENKTNLYYLQKNIAEDGSVRDVAGEHAHDVVGNES